MRRHRHTATPREARTRSRTGYADAPWRRRALLAKAVVLTAFVTVAFIVGTTQAAFSDGDQNPTNHFEAGYWVPRHIGLVGTASCAASTTDVITVTAPIPAGRTLIVRMTTRDGNVSNPTASDSKGNVYQRDAYVDANKIDYAIFSAAVATALAPGDTITVTHAAGTKGTFVRVDEFDGIASAARVHATNSDSGNANAALVSAGLPAGNALVVAGVGVKDAHTVTPTGGWTILNNETTACNKDLTSTAGYRVTSVTSTAAFAPSWPGAKAQYAAAIVVYHGG